ncbi:MAG: DUF2384 domain-containing protein [Burkholderiaceae bacterium]|nr:DUF2384 domain-containing protein [Burkholderiaceae bacterium]
MFGSDAASAVSLGRDLQPAFKRRDSSLGQPPPRALESTHATVRTALALQKFWGLPNEALLRVLGLPSADEESVGQVLVTYSGLSDVKRRLKSLLIIRGRLSAMLGGDRDSERAWLNATWPNLDGASPMTLMDSGEIDKLLLVESRVRELAGS